MSGVPVHPQYDPVRKYNDITLLRVDQPLELNHWVTPVCIPSFNFNPTLGEQCVVAGWGAIAEDGDTFKYSNILILFDSFIFDQ